MSIISSGHLADRGVLDTRAAVDMIKVRGLSLAEPAAAKGGVHVLAWEQTRVWLPVTPRSRGAVLAV